MKRQVRFRSIRLGPDDVFDREYVLALERETTVIAGQCGSWITRIWSLLTAPAPRQVEVDGDPEVVQRYQGLIFLHELAWGDPPFLDKAGNFLPVIGLSEEMTTRIWWDGRKLAGEMLGAGSEWAIRPSALSEMTPAEKACLVLALALSARKRLRLELPFVLGRPWAPLPYAIQQACEGCLQAATGQKVIFLGTADLQKSLPDYLVSWDPERRLYRIEGR